MKLAHLCGLSTPQQFDLEDAIKAQKQRDERNKAARMDDLALAQSMLVHQMRGKLRLGVIPSVATLEAIVELANNAIAAHKKIAALRAGKVDA